MHFSGKITTQVTIMQSEAQPSLFPSLTSRNPEKRHVGKTHSVPPALMWFSLPELPN